ncbi:hypothetical protein [Mesorhizobium sp. LNHC221B00]|uniref:hypothetical protein n=1 Tax=Mesorhizobium sp. LNHC221B00 TaxID=1287233 RepID=UPI001FD92A0F|nr:hypothetical protein [Mesorhizobium sp. LNHC221B00]
MEQQRRQGLPQMPFDVIGEHAQKDMSAYAWRRPVADRPDFEIDGLQGSEGPLDTRQILIGLDRFCGVEMLGGHAGTDDVNAVEASLLLDLPDPSLPSEGAIADLDICKSLNFI